MRKLCLARVLAILVFHFLAFPSRSSSNSSCKTKSYEISLMYTKACQYSKRSSTFFFNGAKVPINIKTLANSISKLEDDYLSILWLKEIYADVEDPSESKNERQKKGSQTEELLAHCCEIRCSYLDFIPLANC